MARQPFDDAWLATVTARGHTRIIADSGREDGATGDSPGRMEGDVVGPDGAQAEKAFLATVRALARAHGWLCYHTYRSARSEKGFPDLVLTNGHAVIFAELKTQKGKLTKEQATWVSLLMSTALVEVYVWRPSDTAIIAKRLSCTRHPFGGKPETDVS